MRALWFVNQSTAFHVGVWLASKYFRMKSLWRLRNEWLKYLINTNNTASRLQVLRKRRKKIGWKLILGEGERE